MKRIYYFIFTIFLFGVIVAIGCRKQDTGFEAEKTSDLKASPRAELLLKLDPSLRNVQDFSNDIDMVEFTKLMKETMEFRKANIYTSFRAKEKRKKVIIQKGVSKSDLKKAYLEAGRGDEFEKLSASFDKQASLVTSFMKRHPELSKLSQDELTKIFLKVFKLNYINAPKKSVSIYRKVQETDIGKCQETYLLNSNKADTDYSNHTAEATALYVIAETACVASTVGYGVCWAAATASYALALYYIEEEWNTDYIYNMDEYNICMSGLSNVSGEYKKRTMMTYSL